MIEKKESGKVVVSFELRYDGSPGNFKILEEPHKGVGNNVIELIRKYGKWNPGILDGKPMVTRYSLPINLMYVNDVGAIRIDGFKSMEPIKKSI